MKGDYHVLSDTGFIRHGAVVCRIVNLIVTSPLNILTKFGVWLSRSEAEEGGVLYSKLEWI